MRCKVLPPCVEARGPDVDPRGRKNPARVDASCRGLSDSGLTGKLTSPILFAYTVLVNVSMSSLSILARGERLRERLLTDVAADLRITGFQSPAEDEKEEGLSLDRLTGLGAPHIWGVQVLDDSLVGFGIFPGDRLIVNRAASHLDDKLVVVDLGGEGYRVRLVQQDLFGGRWLKAADPAVPDVQLDGEEIIEVWGVVSWVISRVSP